MKITIIVNQALIDRGADIGAEHSDGCTALMLLSGRGCLEAVQV